MAETPQASSGPVAQARVPEAGGLQYVARVLPYVAYASCLIVLLALTLQREPYDDSYFFKRIAVNAIEHGVLAWNVDEGPVYGATSQLFQLIMVGLAALTTDYTMLATRLLLAACLMASFGLTFAMTRGRDHGAAAAFAACSPVMLFTALSGMETALAFVLLGALLLVLYGERERATHWLWAPLLTLAIWFARPDATLLALPLLLERWYAERVWPWAELLVIGLGLCASLIAFKLYYGTALPLPFYAKQQLTTPYDAHFIELSAGAQRTRFAYFTTVAGPLFATALLSCDRRNLALLLAAVSFAGYHLLTTIDVMGMHGRFFAPALPLLCLASARAASPAVRPRAAIGALVLCIGVLALIAALGVLPGFKNRVEGVPIAFYATGSLGMLLLLAGRLWPWLLCCAPITLCAATLLASAWTYRPFQPSIASDDQLLGNHTRHVTVYRGMDVLRACFGEAISVYHSEVGVPGLRFQHGKVTDLAGLLSPTGLFRRQSFDAMCLRDRPEAIFLPHKNYRRLNAEIQAGQCIRDYVRVVRDSSSPLYVRSDLHARYRTCQRKHRR